MRRALLGFLVGLVIAAGAPAVDAATNPDEILADPALEQRARGLTRQLRCMVCQNQSIDDSEAPLARDLRLLVRQRISKGDSDRQVLDFLVERYGEFVLLKPRLEGKTIILWALPPAALIAGVIGLLFSMRRRRSSQSEPATLSAEELRKLSTLVDHTGSDR